ncbi:uncharacterized protein LOC120945789 isoform X1 [Rana temporaria]|uniref:uncharacterized protein LOC120945789 isoform X1 n=1 Tax=Rana temporaria TaxID=8407 RepID=UPI001AAD4ACA|nr:uncharacterized protein LOC120945789 isoform X1 [Rana temporaria]
MKIILLFALFRLSSCQATGCSETPVSYGDDDDCLAKALEDLGYFFPAVAKFDCAYNQFQEDKNEKNYNAAAKEFANALECTGCELGSIFGESHTLADLSKGVAETVSVSLELAVKILGKLGLEQVKSSLFCTVTGKLLTSECLQNALATVSMELITDLKRLYCKLKDSSTTDAATNLALLLKKIECSLDDGLGLENGETLESVLGSVGDKILKKLVGQLLLLTKQANLINGVLCDLVSLKCIP